MLNAVLYHCCIIVVLLFCYVVLLCSVVMLLCGDGGGYAGAVMLTQNFRFGQSSPCAQRTCSHTAPWTHWFVSVIISRLI